MNYDFFGHTCICLARVSTSQQDYNAQITALHKKAEELGLTVVEDIATKESGFRSFDQKEGFSELTQKLKAQNCKIVLCTELSRLSRVKFILEKIKEWFIQNKIQLIVIDLNFVLFNQNLDIDMTTDIVFSVYAALAQTEMADKKKRMGRGLEQLNEMGLSITGKQLFGYTRIKLHVKEKGKYRSILEINEEQADQIKTIFDWYLNGIDGDPARFSTKQICDEAIARGFDKYLHSHRNVKNALNNASYTGEITTHHFRKNAEYWTYGNKDAPKYVPCPSRKIKFPQIISREVFGAVQLKKSRASTTKKEIAPAVFADKSRSHVTLLAKMITCPKCGSYYDGDYSVHAKNTSWGKFYYRCCNHKPHEAITMSMRFVDFAVWSYCRLQYMSFLKYVRSYPGSLGIEQAKLRIDNLMKDKQQAEQNLEELVKRYLESIRLIKSKKIEESFEKESKVFKEKIKTCEKMIRKEEELISDAQKAETIASEDSKTVSFIERNKAEMRKFVVQIVKRVIPVYKLPQHYLILQVIPRIETYNLNVEGLKNTIYLLIDSHDNHRPKFRYINYPCEFDEIDLVFHFAGGVISPIQDIFEDIDEIYSIDIPYRALDVYGNDAPKRITDVITHDNNAKE